MYHWPAMSPLCIELIKGAFTLAAVGIGALIALRVYFRQKEYELLKQRYLEGGVDVVAAQLETSFGVVSHNVARCLEICKSFRDTGANFDLAELSRGYLVLDASKFHEVAHHRIGKLVGSQVVWERFQLALAYASSTNAVITREIPEAIRMRLTTTAMAISHAQMGGKMVADLQLRHEAGFKFAVLQKALQAIGNILEAERLSHNAISTFHGRKEVRDIVGQLRAELPIDGEA